MFFKLKFPIIFSLIFLRVFLFSDFSARAVCSEPGASGYLVCEDWDQDTPPTSPWPCTSGPSFHEWDPSDFHLCNALSTSIKHSGARSYHIIKTVGEQGTIDLYHSAGSVTSAYIRFYLYLPTGSATCVGNFWGAHFMFINTATEAQCSLDFRNYPNSGWPPADPEGVYLSVHTYTPGEEQIGHNTAAPVFDWKSHENEWVLVEWYINLSTKKTSLWINQVQQVNDYTMQFPYSTADDVIFSGFSCPASTDCEINYYVDDVVVNTNYIGPRQTSADTTPPSPPSGVSVS